MQFASLLLTKGPLSHHKVDFKVDLILRASCEPLLGGFLHLLRQTMLTRHSFLCTEAQYITPYNTSACHTYTQAYRAYLLKLDEHSHRGDRHTAVPHQACASVG